MRKDYQGLVETLRTSVLEIATASPENREELLTKSFDQFGAALTKQIDDQFGAEPEALAKGLNHISAFASALNRMNQTVSAIKTGRPSYMIDSDSSFPPETVPEETSASLDRFMQIGVVTLRQMVNDSAELPADDAALERAEKAGLLLKMEIAGEEVLFKSELPEDLQVFFTDPAVLAFDFADLGRELTETAIITVDDLMQKGAVFTKEDAAEYPEIFGPLSKEFPPKKKPAAAAGDDDPDAEPDEDPDDLGTGDGDQANGGGAADQGQGNEVTDVTDDMPTDPLQILARLGTAIVVIATSLAGGAAGDGGTDMNAGAGAEDNVGLQRGEPIEDMPLAKMLGGGFEVDASIRDKSLSEILAEVADLRLKVPELQKRATEADDNLAKMKAAMEKMGKTPAPAVGVAKVVSMTKREDGGGTGDDDAMDILAKRIVTLQKIAPEGDAAAATLIKAVHSQGGRPFAAFEG